ncbi:MAG TPA: carbamoyltransferase C-terminal domain-containing protein [Holophagaceae bacterium]|nr:carbamoyltransferase C-terminal domain-containing protein [Holophagaceae bacterium]
MLICGINASHTASAALIRDGRLISALQEERPTRFKNKGGFPEKAIQRLLEMEGLEWKDVDAYVFGGHETYTESGLQEGDRSLRIRSYKNALKPMGRVKQFLRHTPLRGRVQRQRREAQTQVLMGHGVSRDRIFSIDHHRCHATTAYFGPGADEQALVITIDGAGDYLCATVSIPEEGGRLKRLATVDEAHSIGNLWSVITALLAMVPLEHEYKLMGMAPYAGGDKADKARKVFQDAFRYTEGGWELAPGVPNMLFSYEFWRERLEFTRFDHVCAGLQDFTEAFLAEWVRGWLKRTGRSKIRLSGGVCMNVKLNKAIGELAEVSDLFVFPSCGDETNAIGAAWAHMVDLGQAHLIEPLKTLYLGPEPTREDYDAAADQARSLGWKVELPGDLEEAVVDLLARGEVVARVAGREEFGARSLGNRAILGDPISGEVVRVVNKAIKSRDFWMPFAPSVLAEAADRYLHNPKGLTAPYMILSFDSRNTGEVKAACHPEDGTIRPQVVSPEANPSYHRLLSCFQQRTGRGALLNTSLNIHGEPIVSTAADAIDVMKRSGLHHLSLGPYLISKPDRA